MDDWETNLRDGMSPFGMNNLKALNKDLEKWIDEWIKVVSNIDGIIIAKRELGHFYPNPNATRLSIRTENDGSPGNILKFEAMLEFITNEDGRLALSISAIEKYSPDFPKVFPNWVEEEITDIEIREKGFVLEVLNIRFLKFLKWSKTRVNIWENI